MNVDYSIRLVKRCPKQFTEGNNCVTLSLYNNTDTDIQIHYTKLEMYELKPQT